MCSGLLLETYPMLSASEAMATTSCTSELSTATGQSSDSEHEPRLPFQLTDYAQLNACL